MNKLFSDFLFKKNKSWGEKLLKMKMIGHISDRIWKKIVNVENMQRI